MPDRVLTGDAQFTQGGSVPAGGGTRGRYFFAVKGSQPTRLQDITAIWDGEPEAARATQVDWHGDRIEQRRLWVSELQVGYSDWPHLSQVCRLEGIVRIKGKTRRKLAYAVTSLPPAEAKPQRLLALWRGHWGIENRVRWVRDVSFAEDRPQVRMGSAHQIMAALRNLTISVIRLAGETNIAAAVRRHADHPSRPLALIGAVA